MNAYELMVHVLALRIARLRAQGRYAEGQEEMVKLTGNYGPVVAQAVIEAVVVLALKGEGNVQNR